MKLVIAVSITELPPTQYRLGHATLFLELSQSSAATRSVIDKDGTCHYKPAMRDHGRGNWDAGQVTSVGEGVTGKMDLLRMKRKGMRLWKRIAI